MFFLFRNMLLHSVSFWDVYRGDIRIKGFMNYIDRKWTRWFRKIDREANDEVWNGEEDVLDLCILFGDKIYEPEIWD